MRDNIVTASPIATVTFRDDGRYEVLCPQGHSSVTILQQQKFEVLFEIGAYAIIDGYYREAVSSFTSSLERFYEFFIKAVLLEKGLDTPLKECWKLVSNQSERQLGAFILLYTSEMEHPPTLLNNSRVAFRNEVTHKGKIPTREEAVAYGQAVLDVVRPVMKIVKETYPSGVSQTVIQHLTQCRSDKDDGSAVATLCAPTIISLSNGEPTRDERTLEQVLTELGQSRWR